MVLFVGLPPSSLWSAVLLIFLASAARQIRTCFVENTLYPSDLDIPRLSYLCLSGSTWLAFSSAFGPVWIIVVPPTPSSVCENDRQE